MKENPLKKTSPQKTTHQIQKLQQLKPTQMCKKNFPEGIQQA